jgi:hypothetical protein
VALFWPQLAKTAFGHPQKCGGYTLTTSYTSSVYIRLLRFKQSSLVERSRKILNNSSLRTRRYFLFPNSDQPKIILPTCRADMGGRDSSVGIATRYGLDGPGIESRWGRGFSHTSSPALGPTQPPIPWVPGLSRG